MPSVMKTLALIQLLLPLAAIIWLALGRPCRIGDLLLRIVAAVSILLGVWLAGIWLALPLPTVQFLALLLAIASGVAVLRFRLARPADSRTWVRWSGRAFAVAGLGLALWLTVPALAGRTVPGSTVDLVFPFSGGRYITANGGSTERVNGHLMTLRPEYARWRGESYAVDLIRVDSAGFRTRDRRLLAMPQSPRAYLTWGEPVRAPCSGTVVGVEESRRDMPVPIRDRKHIEGNHVMLRCGPVNVFLGHFRQNGIDVERGQIVAVRQHLGFVGNSGNTDEPHLHIHAQRPGPAWAPLSGDPLFITFEGRFLVRNMVVDSEE